MGEAKRRKEQFRANPKPCVYCGEPATTVDHVPPKGIFLRPRPSNLVTVPACDNCNEGASRDDEAFKVYLSATVGLSTVHARALAAGAHRTLRSNAKLKREALSGPHLWARSRAGSYHLAKVINVPALMHHNVLERTTRGLYWHSYGVNLPYDCAVKTNFYRKLDNTLRTAVAGCKLRNIGGSAFFVYAHAQAIDMPAVSIWIYQFYMGHWAGAFTYPKDVNAEQLRFHVREGMVRGDVTTAAANEVLRRNR